MVDRFHNGLRFRHGPLARFHRKLFFHILRKVLEIEQVISLLPGTGYAQPECFRAAPRLIDQSVVPVFDALFQCVKKSVRCCYGIVHLLKIEGGQSHIRIKEQRSVLLIILPISVYDPACDLPSIGCIIENFKAGVIPSPAGFKFFGSYQILRIVLPQLRVLQVAHQTGVKTHPVQLTSRSEHRCVHSPAKLLEKEAVISEQFIAPIPPQRPCAVIPKDQPVMLCRVKRRAVVDEFCQRLRHSHIRAFLRLRDDLRSTRRRQIQHAVIFVGDIAHPAAAAARVDKEIGLPEVDPCLLHLPDISSRGSKAALQIRPHDIYHDSVIFDRFCRSFAAGFRPPASVCHCMQLRSLLINVGSLEAGGAPVIVVIFLQDD